MHYAVLCLHVVKCPVSSLGLSHAKVCVKACMESVGFLEAYFRPKLEVDDAGLLLCMYGASSSG